METKEMEVKVENYKKFAVEKVKEMNEKEKEVVMDWFIKEYEDKCNLIHIYGDCKEDKRYKCYMIYTILTNNFAFIENAIIEQNKKEVADEWIDSLVFDLILMEEMLELKNEEEDE